MGIKKSSMGCGGMPSLYTLRSPKAQDLFLSRDTVCLRMLSRVSTAYNYEVVTMLYCTVVDMLTS